MKRNLFSYLAVLSVLSLFAFNGYGQQVIGSFPTIDGGFEGQTTTTTTGSIATGTQINNWSISSTTSTGGAASMTLNSSGGRSGSKYITLSNTGSSAIRIQSPTVNTSGAIVNATAYTVQYYYRTPSTTAVTNFQRNISPDGTGTPGTYNAVTMAATSNVWTLVQVSQTSGTSANATKYGIGILRMNGATATTVDVDDYVIYAGAADNTAASSPTSPVVNNATNTTLDVSWTAASGGVDGGGYVVVRFASNPAATDDPNQQGIYAVGNSVINGGTVRYIGTGTSFTDNVGLAANTTYYYKIYTVDKAFNYSAEASASGATLPYSDPTTTSISPNNANAGGSGFTITVNGTNFVNGFSNVTWNGSVRTTTYVSSTQLTATINSSDIATAGSANVGVTTTGAVNPSNNQTFTINTAGGTAQTITFPAIPTKVYGDVPFNPGATASSGLTVTYSSSNTAVATVSGSTVTIVGPGTSTITASQGGNGTYSPAPDQTQLLTVNPKTLTVTGAAAQNKLYDGSTAATITGYSITSGQIVGSDVVTVSGGGTFATATVGTGKAVTAALALGGADAFKYTLTQPTGLTADIIAPILAWDFNGTAGSAATVASTTTDANLNSSTLSRGAGIAISTLANAYSSTNFTVGANLATAVSGNQYLQFTLQPKVGYEASLSSLEANFRRSATGPNTFQWQYSLDGFATAGVNIGSPVSYTATTGSGDAQASVNLSGISALQNIAAVSTVTFRLYPYGATNTGGTFALGLPTTPVNDLAIGGTITVAPTPDITITAAHPLTGNIDQGTVDAIIGGFSVSVATADAYLLGLSVNTAGTYQASDITNFKVWANSTPGLSGATQLGSTQASVGSGGTISVSGLSYSIPSGSSRYVYITASVASAAVPGRTISETATPFTNFNFATSNNAGAASVGAGTTQTITQLDPTIALSNSSPAASNFNQNSTNQIIHSIKLDITTTSATLTGISMTPTGTYQTNDLQANSFKFWVNTANNLTGATQLGTAQAIVSGTPVSVSGLSQVLNNNTTYYILFTTDVAYNAVPGRTVVVGSIDFNDITFASANTTGTNPIPGGNTRTFAAVVPTITIAGTSTTSATIGAPSTSNVIYQFTAAPTVNSAQLSQVSLPLTGTYTTGSITTGGMKLWYNTTNTFGTATVLSSVSVVASGSNLVFSGLSQFISMGSTGFFWVTADIASSAGAGKTIKVNTVTNTAFTFTQGTLTGTPPSGGTFTFTPQPTITEILIPQFIEGNTATNATRIPYVYRVKLGNLGANTTYRYFNSIVNSTDNSTSNGAGNVIFPSGAGFTQTSSAGLSSAGSYGTFTTDASGNYTGWFITEPTGNARFTPGQTVNMRICLNDGNNGTSVISRVTTTSSATVLNFVASAGAGNGTGIRGTSSATAKNIVVLYDNVSGTGRPLTAAVVESDGYAQSGNYPAFYSSVDNIGGAWGTIIPNTNANGIRRIEQRDLATGSIVNCAAVSVNGTWPSGASTTSPTGGTTAIVIASSDAPLNTTASTWLGVTSYWFNVNNWSCGIPNSSTADIIIPSNAPNMPALYGNTSVRNIDLQGTATIDIGSKTLTIAGVVSGTGTIKGSDLSSLVINGAAGTLNFTSGSRKLKSLVLGTGATASLGTALDITAANGGGNLAVNSGATLTTNGNLTIKSTVAGTASVGQSAGAISGNVTVERYIPQNAFRAWRMLAIPTQGAQTIHQSWQENQAAMANGVPGYGTILTNTSGSGGYDAATQGNSFLSWNAGSNAWGPVASTASAIATTAGYMVYIRGDRSVSPQAGQNNPGATTLRTNGTLYQGTQSSISLPAGQTVLVGNVYASAIDFANVTKSGVNAFTVWDPKRAGSYNLGAFVTFSSLTGYDPAEGYGGSYNAPNSRIESGQAFMVTSSGGGSIQLSEAAKVTGSRNVFKPSGNIQQLKVKLYAVKDGNDLLADGNTVVFNNELSNEVDENDARKVLNMGENIGIARSSSLLTIEGRKPVMEGDEINYEVSNLRRQQTYKLAFDAKNMSGTSAYLVDNYLGTSTELDMDASSVYTFTVDGNAASSAKGRFKVIFRKGAPAPVVHEDDMIINIFPNVITNRQLNLQINNGLEGNYAIRLINTSGQVMLDKVVVAGRHSIALPASLAKGVYLVEVTGGNNGRNIQKIVIQ